MKNFIKVLGAFLALTMYVQAQEPSCPDVNDVKRALNPALSDLKSRLVRSLKMPPQLALRLQIGNINESDLPTLKLNSTSTECQYKINDQIVFKTPHRT